MATPSQINAVTIGGVQHNVDLSKIPSLTSFVNFNGNARPESTEAIHGPIPLCDIALKGTESGYRHCFRSIPANLAQYHTLCETYGFLQVDILGGQGIADIIRDLKTGRPWDRYGAVRSSKSTARDTAFKLLYFMLLGEICDEIKDSNRAFNAVLFIVSPRSVFKWKTRSVIRAAYEERFTLSTKQRAGLIQWEHLNDAQEMDTDGDVKTPEELGLISTQMVILESRSDIM